MIKVGDKVIRVPQFGEMPKGSSTTVLRRTPMRGTVVYIHPKGRFHVVEFENERGQKLRESFMGVD